ncbi:MAG: hypothetical protein LBJ00_06810 [Planctomycetaceae bacterium]|nr:hypothetical protein [Planctomycetaceae bacterium]
MKKTDLVSSLVNAEVNVSIDVTTCVKIEKLGRQGGGGGHMLFRKRKFQSWEFL